MIITIDGPAGSGKSTIAGLLAKKINYIHFNAGALYRGITAFLHTQNFNINNIKTDTVLPKFEIKTDLINGTQHVFVNNKDYTSLLRNNLISTLVPIVSLNKTVQEKAQKCLKEFCNNNNVVIEGRGIGSSVLPNAEHKLYLDCSVEERAKRRFNEEQLKNTNITLDEIKEQIKLRDTLDKTREIAPLVVPENAIVIDTSNLTIDEVIDKIINALNFNWIFIKFEYIKAHICAFFVFTLKNGENFVGFWLFD